MRQKAGIEVWRDEEVVVVDNLMIHGSDEHDAVLDLYSHHRIPTRMSLTDIKEAVAAYQSYFVVFSSKPRSTNRALATLGTFSISTHLPLMTCMSAVW